MNNLVITFPSTNYALKAERVLQKAGLQAKCITSPRQITADCGLALLAFPQDQEQIIQLLAAANVDVEEYHLLEDL